MPFDPATADPGGQTSITVTKMDVARRQLVTAIRMWFHDDEPISIHTLAFASHEIIHRLYKERGHKDDLLFDTKAIKELYRKDWSLMLKESAGFFKHADRGQSGATHVFMPGRNFLFLFMSVVAIGRIFDELKDEEAALMYWARVRCPDWFDPEKEANPIPPNELAKIAPMTKREFFAHVVGRRVAYRDSSRRP